MSCLFAPELCRPNLTVTYDVDYSSPATIMLIVARALLYIELVVALSFYIWRQCQRGL